MKNLAERLKFARTELGLSQDELARRARLKNQSIIGGLEAQHRKNSTHIPAIAAALGVSASWLSNGTGSMRAEEPIADYRVDTITVPILANAGEMGSGAQMLDEDQMIDVLTLKLKWVAKYLPKLNRPESLHFIHGVGQSMEPTYNHGDLLLVDTSVRQFDGNGVYILEAQTKLFIKRVTARLDGGLQVSTDNPAEKIVEILNGDHSVEIRGRVVWAWNGKRL